MSSKRQEELIEIMQKYVNIDNGMQQPCIFEGDIKAIAKEIFEFEKKRWLDTEPYKGSY